MERRGLFRSVHRYGWSVTIILAAMLCAVSVDASAAAQRKVLVLSLAEGGHQQDGLRAEIGQLVQRAGGQVIDAAAIPAAQRSCEDPSCLSSLAHDQRVDLILAGRIERRSRFERLVDMWIFDKSTGRDQQISDLCDARDLKDCVVTISGRLIGPLLDPGAKPEGVLKPLTPIQTPAAKQIPVGRVAVRPGGPMSSPTWRTGLGVSLGLLTLGALSTAIWATAMNHKVDSCYTCSNPGSGWFQTTPLLAAGYAIAGASALGASLTFLLPRSASQEVRR